MPTLKELTRHRTEMASVTADKAGPVTNQIEDMIALPLRISSGCHAAKKPETAGDHCRISLTTTAAEHAKTFRFVDHVFESALELFAKVPLDHAAKVDR